MRAFPLSSKDLLKEIPIVDGVLEAHATELGGDFTAYRNHAYRVANLCLAFSTEGQAHQEKIATAAVFHDLGIWTDHTFDYLPPSVRLARGHLIDSDKAEWIPQITKMILEHHRISPHHGDPLVEQFRCADWVDVSKGLIIFGLSRTHVQEIFAAWPDAGFHKRLVLLGLKRLRTHPWNPLPMVRL
ncbi:MAG: hypothetical protein DMG14_09210 [Acidobacteria bacterium]|nr:MAG: hypothetical protein DMG14_09210 [Acidobacteriota bacterium]